jgi:sigma-B regulation protein RsbU (phosphoserine phosphatase)
VGAEQGVITLVEQQPDEPGKTLVRCMVTSAEQQPFHIDQCVMGWMYLNKKPLLVDNPQDDDRFTGTKWDPSIGTLLSVPLLVASELKGILTVYNKKDAGGFTDEDQRLLAIIAAQSAQVVENARLREEERELMRVQNEIRVASEIQLALLPKTSPEISGYDIAGVSIPAQVIGGDYFDFIPVDEDRVAICLGDVSGKGLPAALLMANLQATIRGQTHTSHSPAQCLECANALLFRSTEPDKFATLFLGTLDTRKHELRCSSAGHERPFLLSRGRSPLRLEARGIILSFMEEFAYEEAVVSLNPGDMIVIFSDGITDAINDFEEPYGEERLAALLEDSREESASGVIDKIVLAVQQHAGECPQMDDMTLIVVKREERVRIEPRVE